MCAPERRPPLSARAQRGLSIIELMVGIVVSLLVALAAAGSATVFTASQRQGMGSGGAMVNAGTALAALKNDASAAGLGFFGDSRYLCSRLNLSLGASMVTDGSAFAPVRITTEAGGDRVDVVYATQVASGTNVLLAAATAGGSAALKSLLPAQLGDAVLLAPPTPGDPCVVRSVTAITPSTPTSPQLLNFDGPGQHNQVLFTTPVT
ncbi:MAG: prepilin-type N-terminal cleavage/methylation domain-containing protein, partial [Rubrivivax sp.]|nr:prepilin-type N-terminal cleavage/methylation domain-containing protein [Rubrivivax sp.]